MAGAGQSPTARKDHSLLLALLTVTRDAQMIHPGPVITLCHPDHRDWPREQSHDPTRPIRIPPWDFPVGSWKEESLMCKDSAPRGFGGVSRRKAMCFRDSQTTQQGPTKETERHVCPGQKVLRPLRIPWPPESAAAAAATQGSFPAGTPVLLLCQRPLPRLLARMQPQAQPSWRRRGSQGNPQPIREGR